MDQRNEQGSDGERAVLGIEEVRDICALLVPHHTRMRSMRETGDAHEPAEREQREWNAAINQGTIGANSLERFTRERGAFMGTPARILARTGELAQWRADDRRALARVIEQVATQEPVEPASPTFEMAVRATWGTRASTLARSLRGGAPAGEALAEAIECAWSRTLWSEDRLRWKAQRYLEAIAATGGDDRIGARATLEAIGAQGPRRSWSGPVPTNAVATLAGLYHRCTGTGETTREARERGECARGGEPEEGPALWRECVEGWLQGEDTLPPAEARAAARAWSTVNPARGNDADLDDDFTGWVQTDPEWAGRIAASIEAFLVEPDWEPWQKEQHEHWLGEFAQALHMRLSALGGTTAGTIPEASAGALAAECAARGADGSQAWIDATLHAAESMERTAPGPVLTGAGAQVRAGLALGAHDWAAMAEHVEQTANIYRALHAGDDSDETATATNVLHAQSAEIRAALAKATDDELDEAGTEGALTKHVEADEFTAAIIAGETAAERWPENAAIAAALVIAYAGAGLRLASAEGLVTLDAMDNATLEHVVDAGAAIEAMTSQQGRSETEIVEALIAHGVDIPMSNSWFPAIARMMRTTDTACDAKRWGEVRQLARSRLGEELARRCATRIVEHRDPDPQQTLIIAAEMLDDRGCEDATSRAFERTVILCGDDPPLLRTMAAHRCENLAFATMTQALQTGAGTIESAPRALTTLAEELETDTTTARRYLNAWKRCARRGMGTLCEALGEMAYATKFERKTIAAMGRDLTVEMAASLHMTTSTAYNTKSTGMRALTEAASTVQRHDEYAAWRAWLGAGREDDDPAVTRITETPTLDGLAKGLIGLDARWTREGVDERQVTSGNKK